MTYTLNIDQPALTRFQKLPKPIQQALLVQAQVLQTQPLAGQPLHGHYRLLRALHLTLAHTAYLILYQVFERSETLVIRLALPRTTIYRHLEVMKRRP